MKAVDGGPPVTGQGAPSMRRDSFAERYEGLIYPSLTLLGLLAAWQAWVVLAKVPLYLIPPPSQVVVAMFTKSSMLLANSLITLQEILLGFLLSIAVAIPLAIMIVASRPFEKSIYPLLVASQVVPKVAIAPLFIVWFGFGMLPKVLIAFLIAFFPIVIDSVIGLRSMEIEKLYLAQSMGASRWHIFSKIRLPNALPNIMGGLKVAATLSVIGAIAGEFVGADAGMGRVLLVANGNLDTVTLFAAVGYLTIIGIVMFLIMDVLERVLIPWHVSRRIEHSSH
jgi:NitT/TauT family transport system permease protein